MVLRSSDRLTSNIPNLRGGHGVVHKLDYNLRTKPTHMKLLSDIYLDSGCSIGTHIHQDEYEIFICCEGELVLLDNGIESILHSGDISICLPGESHSISNHTAQTAHFYAIIITC